MLESEWRIFLEGKHKVCLLCFDMTHWLFGAYSESVCHVSANIYRKSHFPGL